MNLTKLFETQKKLDDRIVEEKGLQGVDLLDKKILALLVELGELANEERSWKFWSEDQDPRTKHTCNICGDREELSVYDFHGELVDIPCFICEEVDESHNPLLEEYVDCLHFILSIGNDIELGSIEITCDYTKETTTGTFIEMFRVTSELIDINFSLSHVRNGYYHELINLFIGLGEKHLGFTTDQIEQAYYAKNKINHERQENGY